MVADPDDDPESTSAVAEPVLGEVPGPVLDFSEACRRYVLGAYRVELDHEPETLPVLDEWLRVVGAEASRRPEALPLIVKAAGAYLGEVVRRRVECFWRYLPAADEWVLSGRRALFTLHPAVLVRARVEPSSGAGLGDALELAPEDEELARERLAALPAVSEEEFELLSTRVEAFEIVVEALRAAMQAEGRESILFDEADYSDD